MKHSSGRGRLSYPRKIAVLHPLGDLGINQVIFEICEALGDMGVAVDVYTPAAPELPSPKKHRRLHVLGSLLTKQRRQFRTPIHTPPITPEMDWVTNALEAPSSPTVQEQAAPVVTSSSRLRNIALTAELAAWLRLRNYDWIWTHWPYFDTYWNLLPTLRSLGLPVVHSVHNVLPHESSSRDVELCRAVYDRADALIVHSEEVLSVLEKEFSGTAKKSIVVPLPTYTMFAARPGSRERVREQLGVAPGQSLAISCGLVRPYKNLDAVVEAAKDPRLANMVFAISGVEAGYPDLVPGDRLGRIRRLAHQAGVAERFRFLPGYLANLQMSELMEAADIDLVPYTRSYGSARLMLAMTFGKAVVATQTGGFTEYLRAYGGAALIEDAGPAGVADGLVRARELSSVRWDSEPRFQPANIARAILEGLAARTVRKPEH